jgi:hypothetical protein
MKTQNKNKKLADDFKTWNMMLKVIEININKKELLMARNILHNLISALDILDDSVLDLINLHKNN